MAEVAQETPKNRKYIGSVRHQRFCMKALNAPRDASEAKRSKIIWTIKKPLRVKNTSTPITPKNLCIGRFNGTWNITTGTMAKLRARSSPKLRCMTPPISITW